MSDELKPCPFYKDGVPKYHKSQYGHTIMITDPKTRFDDEYYRIGWFKTKEEAITAWNSRTDERAEMQAAICELREALASGSGHLKRKALNNTKKWIEHE